MVGVLTMSVSIINFTNAKLALETKKFKENTNSWRPKTEQFASYLSDITANSDIDPVHKATLMMAKAIDVLATAGPVPSSIDEQNARSANLLQTIFQARKNTLEKSVRIYSPTDLNFKAVFDDFK